MTADYTGKAAPPAMHYVGLDVHARRSSVCVLNDDGKTLRQFEVRGDWPVLLERVAADVPRPFAVAFEASCGYGYLHGRLSALADRVAVAHPGKLRLIYGATRKNDRVDAASRFLASRLPSPRTATSLATCSRRGRTFRDSQ